MLSVRTSVPSWPMVETPQCSLTVYGSGGLQDPPSGSLEVPPPSAHLPMLGMVPTHPGELFGVCRAPLDPTALTSSAQPPHCPPSEVASQPSAGLHLSYHQLRALPLMVCGNISDAQCSGRHLQGGANVGETQSLFLYYYLSIIVLVSIRTTVNLLLPCSVYNLQSDHPLPSTHVTSHILSTILLTIGPLLYFKSS